MVNNFTPLFMLIANDVDVTASLTLDTTTIALSDNDGDVCDELSISVVGDFKRPTKSDVLDFYMGYKESGLSKVGRYFVQTSERIDMQSLNITATSVNWSESLKESRDAKYEKTTVAGIAKTISERHKLKLKSDCEDLTISYMAQSDESDLEFLSRVAEKFDLIYNIKNETIAMLHRTKESKKSQHLPVFIVDASECYSISIRHSNRTYYESATATYRDTKTNKHREVKIGDEKPTLGIKDDYKSESEATQSAIAELSKANRGMKSGSLSLKGELIFAGGVLNLTNAGEDSGEYSIKSVTHTLDGSGWNIDVGFEA